MNNNSLRYIDPAGHRACDNVDAYGNCITAPAGGYFTYASAVDEYLYSTSLNRISHTEYVYDTTTTGNLTSEKDFDGAATPNQYRQIDYQYVTNTTPSVWILDKVARRTLKDASLAAASTQEYGYDGSLPATGSPTLGDLTLSRQVNGTQTIDTKYLYDSYGNVIETRKFKAYGSTSSQPSGTYVSYLTGYDTALKTYVVSSDPPLIPATTTGYNFGLGVPTTVTDANGNITTSVYDGLGRVTSITYPGSAQANIKYTYPTPPVSAPFALKMEMWDQTASVYRATWEILDGLGRVIQTQSPYQTAGVLVLTDTSYNAQGLTLYSGLPRTITATGGSHLAPTWASVPHTTTSYDAVGRVTSVAYPDSSSETISYSGLRTTAIDRNSHKKVQENDAFGRLSKVEEYTGSNPYALYATTTYQYDVRDLLTQVIDAASNQTTITYDKYSRKTAMTDPDMGSWTYTNYDVFGNLGTQTDARGCATTVTYDDLNRPTGKTYSGPGACAATPAVTYTYDSVTGGNEGLGRRTGMTDGSGSTAWSYNVLGQLTKETHTIESTAYTISTTFDAFGRPLNQTVPSQGSTENLYYTYNAMGALSSLANGSSSYVSQIHYNAAGQATDQVLGNSLVQQFCYNADTLRLTNLRVYAGTVQPCANTVTSPKLNLSYSYQANGNINQIVDATRSETLTFTYDELDRLDVVSGAYSQDYNYNTIGNITQKNTTTYTYGNGAHKHAVTALSTGESYTYDANGNMTQRVEGGLTYTQTFDAENRLISVAVSGQTTQFVYDGDGNLVKKINPDGTKTIYVGALYEVNKNSGGTVTSTKTFYTAGGAMRVDGTRYYILKDNLGSASVVTNQSAATVGENRYYPFGETRVTTGNMQTDKLFTGQHEITGLGIYNFGARFYSPKLGRFLSPDTIVPGYANPQNLNRMSYANNNSLRYTDPTGHRACDDVDAAGNCITAPGGGGMGFGGLPKKPSGGGSGGSGGSGSGGGLPMPDPNVDSSGGSGTEGYIGGSLPLCGQMGIYSPKCPDWHFYTRTDMVCPAEFECAASEMKDYLSRYAYPGQDHSFPVVDKGVYPIMIIIPNSDYGFSIGGFPGRIRVSVSDDGMLSINRTLPGHIFHDGIAIRKVYQADDGDWYVTTYSYGNNHQFHTAGINNLFGPGIFNDLDREMRDDIESHH